MATENPHWFSTYGLLTAERVLERFDIHLSQQELVKTLKDDNNPYHYLLTIPLKNIFNGILINQVYDYQVYAQKLLIDYRLAQTEPPPNPEEAEVSGAEVELLFKENELKTLGERFEGIRYSHMECVSETQAWLIQATKNKVDIANAPEVAQFNARVDDLGEEFRNLRASFKEMILTMIDILSTISNYKLDPELLAKHQEEIDFDGDLADFQFADETE